jgi:arabinose-5-phosphate isomerase
MLVEDVMRPLAECRLAGPTDTVREVFARPLPARRTGAVMILDDSGTLAGIFTDSDLARLFERRHDATLDEPIGSVMTRRPTTLPVGMRLRDAVAILESRRLSELPVLDAADRPVGLVDIVDLVGLVPPELIAAPRQAAAA